MLTKIDLSRFDLNLLVVFETVMEERSVVRAAARLHLSPSAISHRLGKLRRVLNDPLFLKHPKGVVPTERATELSAPISEALARVRGVVAEADAFDPASSARRFTIGAPDGVSAVTLPALVSAIGKTAPRIDFCERVVMPELTLDSLDKRAIDIAVAPIIGEMPVRFEYAPLYEEEFVIAMRAGNPLTRGLTLKRYCSAPHLLVSASGDPQGFVDDVLAVRGLTRRVAFVASSFMLALAAIGETDLIAAIPRRLAEEHCDRFGLVFVPPPLAIQTYPICVITTKAAMADAGVAWLFGRLQQVVRETPPCSAHRHS